MYLEGYCNDGLCRQDEMHKRSTRRILFGPAAAEIVVLCMLHCFSSQVHLLEAWMLMSCLHSGVLLPLSTCLYRVAVFPNLKQKDWIWHINSCKKNACHHSWADAKCVWPMQLCDAASVHFSSPQIAKAKVKHAGFIASHRAAQRHGKAPMTINDHKRKGQKERQPTVSWGRVVRKFMQT
jgi:hypothetical protein